MHYLSFYLRTFKTMNILLNLSMQVIKTPGLRLIVELFFSPDATVFSQTFVFPAVWAQWQACRKDAFQETLVGSVIQ